MLGVDTSQVPRLRPSLLPLAGQCRLRFTKELAGEAGGLRFSRANLDRRFLLNNLLGDAIYRAHAADARGEAPLADLHHAPVPEGLLAEERWLFTRALDHYVELAADRTGTVIRFDDDTFPQFRWEAHSSARFALSFRIDLALRLPDGGIEVRKLARGAPFGALADDPTARFTALSLLRAGEHLVRYAHFDLLHGDVAAHDWAWSDAAVLARGVADPVLEALDDPRPAAVPDWWCHECPYLRVCPAVSQQPAEALVLLATGEVG